MNPHPDSHQAMLSEQAMNELGLQSQPFSERPAGHEYYSDPVMQMQLNMLQHNIKFSDMLQVLKGDAGCGKTALIVQMLAEANDEFQIFIARGKASLSAAQIISGMLKIFQQPVPDNTSTCVKLLTEHLKIRLDKNLSSVLIIENAHLVSVESFNQLFEHVDALNEVLDGELRILLVAEPEIESMLPQLTSKQLQDGKLFISNVRTLDRRRTGEYVLHRLQNAGYRGELPLSGKQLTELYTNTNGLPQQIDSVAASLLNQQVGQQSFINQDRWQSLPLRLIGGIAAGCIALSIVLFLLPGGSSEDTELTGNVAQTTVELAPTVISEPNTEEDLQAPPPPPPTEEPASNVEEPTIIADQEPDNTVGQEVEVADPADAPPAAATITLLSETPPTNDAFAESHNVESPAPPAKKTEPKVEPKKVEQKPAPATPKKTTITTAKRISDSERWLLKQKPSRYTIQLLASYDPGELKRYAKANAIESKTAMFATVREARVWHVLTYGLYANAEAARAAITKLPASLQSKTPWIRSIKSVQLAINK